MKRLWTATDIAYFPPDPIRGDGGPRQGRILRHTGGTKWVDERRNLSKGDRNLQTENSSSSLYGVDTFLDIVEFDGWVWAISASQHFNTQAYVWRRRIGSDWVMSTCLARMIDVEPTTKAFGSSDILSRFLIYTPDPGKGNPQLLVYSAVDNFVLLRLTAINTPQPNVNNSIDAVSWDAGGQKGALIEAKDTWELLYHTDTDTRFQPAFFGGTRKLESRYGANCHIETDLPFHVTDTFGTNHDVTGDLTQRRRRILFGCHDDDAWWTWDPTHTGLAAFQPAGRPGGSCCWAMHQFGDHVYTANEYCWVYRASNLDWLYKDEAGDATAGDFGDGIGFDLIDDHAHERRAQNPNPLFKESIWTFFEYRGQLYAGTCNYDFRADNGNPSTWGPANIRRLTFNFPGLPNGSFRETVIGVTDCQMEEGFICSINAEDGNSVFVGRGKLSLYYDGGAQYLSSEPKNGMVYEFAIAANGTPSLKPMADLPTGPELFKRGAFDGGPQVLRLIGCFQASSTRSSSSLVVRDVDDPQRIEVTGSSRISSTGYSPCRGPDTVRGHATMRVRAVPD